MLVASKASQSVRFLMVATVLGSMFLPLGACAQTDENHSDGAQKITLPEESHKEILPPVVSKIPEAEPVTQVQEVQIPPLPNVSSEEALVEAERLKLLMKKSIKRYSLYEPEQQETFISLAHEEITKENITISRPQLVMVVDRNERVQRLDLVLAMPDQPWQSLGGTPVSTGTTGRKYYYITPIGVFQNTADRLGYRAEGTKNKNGIRGIGIKGSRVWDMGWQTATKGWLPKEETGQIRLEVHATDPDYLEQRLGHPASEGCIRIPATLNQFMDHNGVIDALYEQAAAYDPRFRGLLLKDRKQTPIAGDLVVVIDSGPLTKPKIDPIADQRSPP